MRIRSIKPEVLMDVDLWDLEQETGLPIFRAFTGLWCAADREGRFEWSPRTLKPRILPHWEGDFSRVLDALESRGFLVRYACQGRSYGWVRTFKKHQVPNNKEKPSTLPAPPELPNNFHQLTRESRVTNATSTPLEKDLVEGEQEGNGKREGEREDLTHTPARGRAGAMPSQSDLRRGNDFMLSATTRSWQGFDRELMLIGMKSAHERDTALAAIRRDPWCQANMPKVSPAHVLRKWNDYSTGALPIQQPRDQRGPSAIVTQEELANEKAGGF